MPDHTGAEIWIRASREHLLPPFRKVQVGKNPAIRIHVRLLIIRDGHASNGVDSTRVCRPKDFPRIYLACGDTEARYLSRGLHTRVEVHDIQPLAVLAPADGS